MSCMLSLQTLAAMVAAGDVDTNSAAYRWGHAVGYITMAILTAAVIVHFIRKGRK